jgi:uncharacterized membrane protein
MGQTEITDPRQFEKQLATLLRVGVILAAIVVLVGGAIYLANYGSTRPDYKTFYGEPAEYRQVGKILREAVCLRGRGLIQLGLLLLIATPIARVALSAFDFLRERDWLYVMVTLIVLSVLVYGLVSG